MRSMLIGLLAMSTACGSSATIAPDGPAARAAAPSGSAERVLIGEQFDLRSKILGTVQTVDVYRPSDMDNPGPYPVIYLTDADIHFQHATGLIQFLAVRGVMPPAIVVGMGRSDRQRDFTPSRTPDAPTSGGAERFLEYIERELIPTIEARYGAAQYRVLIGHSLAGLFALHVFASKPEVFDAIIATSPTLSWPAQNVAGLIEGLLRARPPLEKTLYLAVGAEGKQTVDHVRALAEGLRQHAPPSVRWQFDELPGEDHSTVPHRAFYRGLELVFQDWRLPATTDSLAAVEAHYARLREQFPFPVVMPMRALDAFGMRLFRAGRVDEALEVFRRNLAVHPGASDAHASLAKALETKGDLTGAIKSYARAVEIAAAEDDPELEVFQRQLERARSRAAKK